MWMIKVFSVIGNYNLPDLPHHICPIREYTGLFTLLYLSCCRHPITKWVETSLQVSTASLENLVILMYLIFSLYLGFHLYLGLVLVEGTCVCTLFVHFTHKVFYYRTKLIASKQSLWLKCIFFHGKSYSVPRLYLILSNTYFKHKNKGILMAKWLW